MKYFFLCALLNLLFSGDALATQENLVMHGLYFDAKHENQEIQILAYRYGNSNVHGTYYPEIAQEIGKPKGYVNLLAPMPLGDFLSVTWRSKKTGEISQETVDLKPLLRGDLTWGQICFHIVGQHVKVSFIPDRRENMGGLRLQGGYKAPPGWRSKGISFKFLAAFDGTSSDRSGLDAAGSLLAKEVSSLEEAWAEVGSIREDIYSYYEIGLKGSEKEDESFPPDYALRSANMAYWHFNASAARWIKENPGEPITVYIASYSRGYVAALIFAQLVWERGVLDVDGMKVLYPPGAVKIAGGLLSDPRGASGTNKLSLPPGAKTPNINMSPQRKNFTIDPDEEALERWILPLMKWQK